MVFSSFRMASFHVTSFRRTKDDKSPREKTNKSIANDCVIPRHCKHFHSPVFSNIVRDVVLFDVVVLFHLSDIADKIYGNHCAPWSVEILIKYVFPYKWGAIL